MAGNRRKSPQAFNIPSNLPPELAAVLKNFRNVLYKHQALIGTGEDDDRPVKAKDVEALVRNFTGQNVTYPAPTQVRISRKESFRGGARLVFDGNSYAYQGHSHIEVWRSNVGQRPEQKEYIGRTETGIFNDTTGQPNDTYKYYARNVNVQGKKGDWADAKGTPITVGVLSVSDIEDFDSVIGEKVEPILLSAVDQNRSWAGVNVNDWGTYFVGNATNYPLGLQIKIDNVNNTMSVRFKSWDGLAGTQSVKFNLEVVGATITGLTNVSAETGEPPTDKGANIDFRTDAGNQYGPNGVVIQDGWSLTADDDDEVVFNLSAVDATVIFRLKVTNITADDDYFVSLGDMMVDRNFTVPLEYWLTAADTAAYDVLRMENAPLEAGAVANWNSLNDDGGKPASYAAVGSALNRGHRMNDLSHWYRDNSATLPLVSEWSIATGVDGPAGDTAFKLVTDDTSAEDVYSEKMPIDPLRTYRSACWVYQPSGDRTGYWGVIFRDQDGNLISNSSTPVSDAKGWTLIGNPGHYIRVVNAVYPATWTRLEVTFGPDGDAEIPTGAHFMQIFALAGRGGTTATTLYLQDFRVEEVVAAVQTVGPAANDFLTDEMAYPGGLSFLNSWKQHSGILTAAEITSITATDQAGGKAMRIGNNAGNDEGYFTQPSMRIQLDPNSLYEVGFVIRRVAGTGGAYLGVAGVDADGDPVNNDGTSGWLTQHYFAATNESPSAWTRYVGYFKGKASSGNGGQHNNPHDPGTVHDNAVYVEPTVVFNYNDQAGQFDLAYCWIRRVPSAAMDTAAVNGTDASTVEQYAQQAGLGLDGAGQVQISVPDPYIQVTGVTQHEGSINVLNTTNAPADAGATLGDPYNVQNLLGNDAGPEHGPFSTANYTYNGFEAGTSGMPIATLGLEPGDVISFAAEVKSDSGDFGVYMRFYDSGGTVLATHYQPKTSTTYVLSSLANITIPANTVYLHARSGQSSVVNGFIRRARLNRGPVVSQFTEPPVRYQLGEAAADADALGGNAGSFYQNASNLNAGTLPDARVSVSNVTQHEGSVNITNLLNAGALASLNKVDTAEIENNAVTDSIDDTGLTDNTEDPTFTTSFNPNSGRVQFQSIGRATVGNISSTASFSIDLKIDGVIVGSFDNESGGVNVTSTHLSGDDHAHVCEWNLTVVQSAGAATAVNFVTDVDGPLEANNGGYTGTCDHHITSFKK